MVCYRYLTCACMYRGLLSMHEIEQQLLDVKHARTGSSHHNFVDWVPDNVMASLCDIPPVGLKVGTSTTCFARLEPRKGTH